MPANRRRALAFSLLPSLLSVALATFNPVDEAYARQEHDSHICTEDDSDERGRISARRSAGAGEHGDASAAQRGAEGSEREPELRAARPDARESQSAHVAPVECGARRLEQAPQTGGGAGP